VLSLHTGWRENSLRVIGSQIILRTKTLSKKPVKKPAAPAKKIVAKKPAKKAVAVKAKPAPKKAAVKKAVAKKPEGKVGGKEDRC
jgi:septal ring-binding cell division protein DamX